MNNFTHCRCLVFLVLNCIICDSYLQECERQLAAKEASLPQEPAADEENALTLLVRMPDGSRRGRRFLKSDKLQVIFVKKSLLLSLFLVQA